MRPERRLPPPPPPAGGDDVAPPISLPRQPARPDWIFADAVIVSVVGSYDGVEAGWGFTVANQSLGFLIDFCGPVVVDAFQPLFIGAHVRTNNTGELSGLIFALRWIREHIPPDQPVIVEYDSEYAALTTQGKYKARANTSLVISARSAYSHVSSRVVWRKMASHTGLFLNDRADTLAKCGASGLSRGVSGPPARAVDAS